MVLGLLGSIAGGIGKMLGGGGLGGIGGLLSKPFQALTSFVPKALSFLPNLFGGVLGGGRGGQKTEGESDGANQMLSQLQRRGVQLARSSADYLVNRAIDEGGNMINRFSQSDFIRRKLPWAVDPLSGAGDAFRNYTRSAYSQLMGKGQERPQYQPQYNQQQTIEREDYMRPSYY